MGIYIVWFVICIFLAIFAVIFGLPFDPWGYWWLGIAYGGFFLLILYKFYEEKIDKFFGWNK